MSTVEPPASPPPPTDRPAGSGVGAVAAIALNELQRVSRDRMALVFILALPILIIVVIGLAFGSREEPIAVGLVDRDGTAEAAELAETLERTSGLEVDRMGSLDELRRDVRLGSQDAGVVVPAGYGRDVEAGRSVDLDLLVDPTSDRAAAVQATVEGAVSDLSARLAAARVAADNGDVRPGDALATADRLAGELPRSEVRTETGGDGGSALEGGGRFSYTVPSNLVLFVFISTMAVGAVLATDRRQGLTRRLLATPHRTATVLAGIAAAKLLFALTQSALLVGIGALVFRVDWGDPVGAALLVTVFALVSTAVGLLVGASVSDAEQAQSVGTPIAIAMGMLGGCMWPLEVVPPAMRVAGHAVPQAWAMDAWVDLIFDGEGVTAILPELAVLAGFAAVLGGLATWRLRAALTG